MVVVVVAIGAQRSEEFNCRSQRRTRARSVHDGVGLLAGTALSQPGQAVSQRRRAGRSPWPPMME
eukprot:COSAG01_NODE_13932_length_1516_cov_5.454481_1_plen_64_part_10